jgi:hypothetical protein
MSPLELSLPGENLLVGGIVEIPIDGFLEVDQSWVVFVWCHPVSIMTFQRKVIETIF